MVSSLGGLQKPVEIFEIVNIPWVGWIFGIVLIALGIFLNIFAFLGKHGFLLSDLHEE